MSTDQSLQERLAEELALLPGRISRYFFLVATLDAQATQMNRDLQLSRQRALMNFNALPRVGDARQNMVASLKQFHAIQELHNAQRQLIADKLFIEKKAAEWFKMARNVVLRYYDFENRKRPRGPSMEGRYLHHSPKWQSDDDMSGGSLLGQSSSIRRFSSHSVSENSYETTVPTKKRRVTTTGYDRTYRASISSRLRQQEGDSCVSYPVSGASVSRRSGSSSVVSDPSYKTTSSSRDYHSHLFKNNGYTEGVIIKLGSQKGRPRKSKLNGSSAGNNSRLSEASSPAVTSTMQQPLESSAVFDEYICPLCGKSESENPSMVACDNCDKWYHCLCVGFVDEADAASKAFYCPNCKNDSANIPDHKKNNNDEDDDF